MSRIRNTAVAVALLVMAVAPSARAQITGVGTTLNVSATVLTSCLMTATPINFGTIDATLLISGTQNYNATGSLSIQCINGFVINTGLSFDGGRNSVPAATLSVPCPGGVGTCQRAMSNGPSALAYDIYEDSGHTDVIVINTPVDNLTPGAVWQSAETPYIYNVYGLVASDSSQTGDGASGLTQGVYTDAIQVTLN